MNIYNNNTLTTSEDNTMTTKEIPQNQRLQEENNAQAMSSPDQRSWVSPSRKSEFPKLCL
jgi:hypothetical protein